MRRVCFVACVLAVCLGPSACGVTVRSWDEAEALAEQKLKNLTKLEQAQLLIGTGWQGGAPAPGIYIGNLPGQPKHGIPWLRMDDSGSGYHNTLWDAVGSTTVWPSPLAAASAWDESSVEMLAMAIAEEFRGKGANVILGPAVNVQRVARGGRNFELMSGEDPLLGAHLARAFIRGTNSAGVLAVVKHFAFNEQETDRMWEASQVDERTAWELYYPPFEAAIDEGAASVMCSYNKVNGTYACSNWNLLTRDLRHRMGFRGFVMSDWWATHGNTLSQGLDMEMPGTSGAFNPSVSMHWPKAVRTAAKRVLSAMYKLRLEEEVSGCVPGPDCIDKMHSWVTSAAHHDLAVSLAKSSITLLKNDDGILPFQASSGIRKIAILGKPAHDQPASYWATWNFLQVGDAWSGGGSSHQTAQHMKSIFLEIRDRARADNIDVINGESHGGKIHDEDVDAFIVFGTTGAMESNDRSSLWLDDHGEHTIVEAAKTGKPVVVCLMLPGAILMPWRHKASAIASMFYGGEGTAKAWASILFGDAEPEGRLPIMMPEGEGDTIQPSGQYWVNYEEGLASSYRNARAHASFPFGHGLAYTSFAFKDVVVQANKELWGHDVWTSPIWKAPSPGLRLSAKDSLCSVHLVVVNTGKRPGREVVQLYLQMPKAPKGTPALRLAAFHKTKLLLPGQQENVSLHLGQRELSVYSSEGWYTQNDIVIFVGNSSKELPIRLPVSVPGKSHGAKELDRRWHKHLRSEIPPKLRSTWRPATGGQCGTQCAKLGCQFYNASCKCQCRNCRQYNDCCGDWDDVCQARGGEEEIIRKFAGEGAGPKRARREGIALMLAPAVRAPALLAAGLMACMLFVFVGRAAYAAGAREKGSRQKSAFIACELIEQDQMLVDAIAEDSAEEMLDTVHDESRIVYSASQARTLSQT